MEHFGIRLIELPVSLLEALDSILEKELGRQALELLGTLKTRFSLPAMMWVEPEISISVAEIVALVKAPIGDLARLIVAEEPGPAEEAEKVTGSDPRD